MSQDTLVDFALVAFREDGQWQLDELPSRAAEDLDALAAATRQQPSDGVSVALCSYGDDFFLALRPHGDDVRLLLSDVTAVGEWSIAQQVVEALDRDGSDDPDPDDPDPDHPNADRETVAPAGDLDIFADLGVSAMEVAAVCGDLDLYPDEMLAQIAARIGFGAQFGRLVEADLP